MPKVNVAGLQDVKPEELLTNARYSVECTKAQIAERKDKNSSLVLNFRVLKGPTQPDGSSPEDRRLSAFFPLSGFEDMKDGGTFVKRNLKEACDAFGVEVDSSGDFDYEDFLLKRADVVTRNRENRETGVPETQVQKFLKESA